LSRWIVPGARRPSDEAYRIRHEDQHELIEATQRRLSEVINETNNTLQSLTANIFFLGRTWVDKSPVPEIYLGKVLSGEVYYIHLPCPKCPKIEKPGDLKVEESGEHFSIRYPSHLPFTDPSKREEIDLRLDDRKIRLILKVVNKKSQFVFFILLPAIAAAIGIILYFIGALGFISHFFGR